MGKDLRGKDLGEGICQRKDGRYTARFRPKGGVRKERIFAKADEARKWLIDARYNDAHGNISASTKMSVEAWYKYWLENVISPNVRRQTREWYAGRYKNRIKPIIGNMQLSEVKPIHCQEVMNLCNKKNDATESMKKLKSL